MIPAQKSPLFEAFFSAHVQGRLRSSFSSLLLGGAEHVTRVAATRPVLWVGNHTSWWDPLVIYHLSRRHFAVDGHAMMDARNLRKLPFFAKIGAFGVDLSSRDDGAESVRYAASLLDRPRRMVTIFAQGKERTVTARPLGFRRGAGEVARLATEAAVLPFAVRYEVGGDERPRIFLRFGAEVERGADAVETTERIEQRVTAMLDELDRGLCEGSLEGYTPLFISRSAFATVASAALSLMTPLRRGVAR